MAKTNKEIIDSLTEYFMQQPPADICRALACMMIDLSRLKYIQNLDKKEKESFFRRLQMNVDQLKMFIEKGPQGKFILHGQNRDD